jgi:hypothetical protein
MPPMRHQLPAVCPIGRAVSNGSLTRFALGRVVRNSYKAASSLQEFGTRSRNGDLGRASLYIPRSRPPPLGVGHLPERRLGEGWCRATKGRPTVAIDSTD